MPFVGEALASGSIFQIIKNWRLEINNHKYNNIIVVQNV